MSVKKSNSLHLNQQPAEKSFLEIGQWKRATERIVQGNESLNNLAQMIQERATLEKKYSSDLQKWNLKFSKIINKSSEYNSTRHAWMESLDEAVKLAELHTTIADSLEEQSLKKVQLFQKENYKKKMMGGFKQVQRYEKEFTKAQKVWEDLYKKQHRAGNEYYQAINSRKSSEKELKNQTMNLDQAEKTGGSGANIDKLKQKIEGLKQKLEKAEKTVNDNRETYQKAVDTCTAEKDRYIDDMNTVYKKTQLDEEKRLKFVRDVLFDVHQRIDLSTIEKFKRIYEDHEFAILKLDVESDIQWWHNTRGMGVMMQWPQFEEYNAESLEKTLSYKQTIRGKNQVPGGSNITTMTYKQRNSFSQEFEKEEEEDLAEEEETVVNDNKRGTGDYSENEENIENNNNIPPSPMKGILPILPAESGIEEEGVLVEAQYNYEAAEDDEISLEPGLRFLQIQAEDDQGWCKGRLEDGSEGLYPANYVKAI